MAEDQPIKLKLKRTNTEHQEPIKVEETSPLPTQGSIDRIIDLTFNPSRDKIREVTMIDRMQGRLLPQLDIINLVWQYIVEIAAYRQDAANYKTTFNKERPLPPRVIEEFMYRTAQWQKSIAGKNLERASDIALAEIETRSNETEDVGQDGHGFYE
jgi:hypothetical protein